MEHSRKMVSDGLKLTQKLKELSPYFDENKTLRAATKLRGHPRIPRNLSDPVIFDKHSEFAQRLVYSLHDQMSHMGGKQSLMANVRREIWVIGLNSLCKE